MTKGSCAPDVPGGFNETILRFDNDQAVAEVFWTWDGVSTYPGCDGPIDHIHLVNTSPDTTYTVQLPRAGKPTSRTYSLTPGSDVTLTGSQLSSRGLDTYSAVLDLNIVPA